MSVIVNKLDILVCGDLDDNKDSIFKSLNELDRVENIRYVKNESVFFKILSSYDIAIICDSESETNNGFLKMPTKKILLKTRSLFTGFIYLSTSQTYENERLDYIDAVLPKDNEAELEKILASDRFPLHPNHLTQPGEDRRKQQQLLGKRCKRSLSIFDRIVQTSYQRMGKNFA